MSSKPGSYIPPWLKPIKVNTRDLTAELRAYTEGRETGLARWLYSTWNAQARAVKYQEIRNAIVTGEVPAAWIEQWRQSYAAVVAAKFRTAQEDVARYAGRQTQVALGMALDPTRSSIARGILDRDWTLIRNLSAIQQDAVRGVLSYLGLQAVGGEAMTSGELAQVLRPLIGLTERETKAVLRWRDELLTQGGAAAAVEHSVQNYAGYLLRRRSERIARTELSWSFNHGQLATMRQAMREGQVDNVLKQWASAEDEVACNVCAVELNGQEVELDGVFSTGVDAPPQHPNCRCGLVYLADRVGA